LDRLNQKPKALSEINWVSGMLGPVARRAGQLNVFPVVGSTTRDRDNMIRVVVIAETMALRDGSRPEPSTPAEG